MDVWRPGTKFYGNGESFVFTFKNQDEIKAFYSTGMNQLYQFCDRKCIGMGGGLITEKKVA